MRAIGNAFGAWVLGLTIAGGLAVAIGSLGTFIQAIPPIPWAIGSVLLIAALAIGFTRSRFAGLAFVGLWAFGVGFAMMMGQGADVGPIHEAVYHAIPWGFVGCCALACLLNAVG